MDCRSPANPMTLQPGSAYMTNELRTRIRSAGQFGDRGSFSRRCAGGGLARPVGRASVRQADARRQSAAGEANTIYDMASLTKVIVTTTSAMMLVQQKAPRSGCAGGALPAGIFGGGEIRSRSNVARPGNCTHAAASRFRTAGAPRFLQRSKGLRCVLAKVLAEPLVHEPGTQVEYSDLGFIMLGEIIQRLTGETLEQFAKEHIFAPLGMNDSFYNPPVSLRATDRADGIRR